MNGKLSNYLQSRKGQHWGLNDEFVRADQEKTQTTCLKCYQINSDKLEAADQGDHTAR